MWNYTKIGTLKHELMFTMSSQTHTNLNEQYLLICRNLKANYNKDTDENVILAPISHGIWE